MSFEKFLNEKKFQVMITDNQPVNYNIMFREDLGLFIALASTGNDNDKELESGESKAAIGKDIEDSINVELKKKRQLFTVEQDHSYQGAGYSFYLNMDDLLKLLNK